MRGKHDKVFKLVLSSADTRGYLFIFNKKKEIGIEVFER
jgi:hypothetical protein